MSYELRFTSYDLRIIIHDSRFTSYDLRVTNHESRVTGHDSRFTGHDSRITNHELRFTIHDSRITNQIIFVNGISFFIAFIIKLSSRPFTIQVSILAALAIAEASILDCIPPVP